MAKVMFRFETVVVRFEVRTTTSMVKYVGKDVATVVVEVRFDVEDNA